MITTQVPMQIVSSICLVWRALLGTAKEYKTQQTKACQSMIYHVHANRGSQVSKLQKNPNL